MAQPRTHLTLESLEAREVPAAPPVLFSETFNSVTPPALPPGWTTWTSDGTTAFTTAAGVGTSGTPGVVSNASSHTAARAEYPQTVSGDTGAAVSLQPTSLVPVYVFARGTNVNTGSASYLAAVVTRGLSVQLLEVNGILTRVLGTVTSPTSSYLSSGWVRVSLQPTGSTVKVEVTRQDTGQYLNSSGLWQTAETAVNTATTSLPSVQGNVGIGRNGVYYGTVPMDDFAVIGNAPVVPPVVPPPPPPPPPPPSPPIVSPPPPVSPPPVSPPPPAQGSIITQSFDTTAVGSAPIGWNGWSTSSVGWFTASNALALSPANGFASNGQSTTAARAWSNTALPADVDASAAVYLNSLIPAQVFVRGTNLQGNTPTYYAVTITRGLQASLVKVVNGVETTIGTINSSAYVSSVWVRARLIAVGDHLQVQLYRTDTQQWLTPDGSWSDSPDFAIDTHDSSITSGGNAGVGRKAAASGIVTVDDFEADPAGDVTGPQLSVTRLNGTGNVTGQVTFQAAVTGSFDRIEFRLNNEVQAASATSPATWTFDSTTVLNGTYTLTVRAFDAAGNVSSQDLTFTVSNPNMNPLPAPTIPQHYSYIRIAELAYSGTPVTNSFEQNLLQNSVDLVVPNPQYLSTINSTSSNTPQLIYSNVSNLYQGLLASWLQYAAENNVSPELAFYHVTQATPFRGRVRRRNR